MTDDHPFAAFLHSELVVERARRATQEGAASAVITTSSAFIALVVGGVALVLGKDFVSSAPWATTLVFISVVLFVGSAFAALVVRQLVPYRVAADSTMTDALTTHWTDSASSLEHAIAWINYDTLTTLRAQCNKKSRWLDWALRLQVTAAVVFAAAIGCLVARV